MQVIEQQKDSIATLPAKLLSHAQLKAVSSELANKILRELVKKPSYPMELAKRLKVHEQKIYYHIRNMEKAGVIDIVRTDTVHGTLANIYAPTSPAYVLALSDFSQAHKLPGMNAPPVEFLSPIVENGELNGLIIVGSPDPHGPEMARSRDGYYGIDFALFLGTFLNNVSRLSVKLDTEVRSEDLQNNLVLIGGPVVNIVTAKVNESLPVRFTRRNGWAIYSALTDKTYHEDSCGIVVKTRNPFNKKKWILVIAGKRYAGTQAVTMAFIKHFTELVNGNRFDKNVPARIIEGLDRDSDGIVDDIEFLE